MNTRPLIILALLVTAICGVAIWFLQNSPPPPALPTLAPVIGSQPEAPLKLNPLTPTTPPPVEAVAPQVAIKQQTAPQPLADWEIKIDNVLRANPDNTEAGNSATAQTLINLLPTLSPDGQTEAAQHISNLISDQDYSRVAPLVRNASLPEDVLDVFVTDLMNRDDTVKLPMLLDIAKIPNHPNREEAATDLQIFLDDDFGTNWVKWDAALKDYLKKQADENADADAPVPAVPKK